LVNLASQHNDFPLALMVHRTTAVHWRSWSFRTILPHSAHCHCSTRS